MIEAGDRIAIGVSGGKDSMSLLILMSQLRRFYPKPFEIEAVTLDLGIYDYDYSLIANLCNKLEINYTLEKTFIGKIVFETEKTKNLCSFCANLKRGALHNATIKLRCNKLALAHNKDDLIETFLMSLLFEGRIHTFSPVTYLARKNIHLIRPLVYCEEKDIKYFINKQNIKVIPPQCPIDNKTTRNYIKELLFNLNKKNQNIKSNLFGAIMRSHIDGW